MPLTFFSENGFLLSKPHHLQPLKLTILGGSLLFEILGAWRRLLCAKQVISLVETIKSVFFPYMFAKTTFGADFVHISLFVKKKFEMTSIRLTRKSFVRQLTRKSSMILFRDSGQTLFILNDFHVSRRMGLQYLKRLSWTSSRRLTISQKTQKTFWGYI
ncbi:hypothetical protein IGI04_014826, partial [Brassica rapa subsp. trilocularis]